jgi:hypothetical protein
VADPLAALVASDALVGPLIQVGGPHQQLLPLRRRRPAQQAARARLQRWWPLHSQLGHCPQAFSFLAIATSYIGFILGLTGFLADGLQLPSSKSPLAYGLTLLPPFALAVTYPDGFLKALDVAGGGGARRRCGDVLLAARPRPGAAVARVLALSTVQSLAPPPQERTAC